MSITRLQQARQMYAMGQRVKRIAFGGGGSQDHHSGGGYQGLGGETTGGGVGSQAGGEGTGTDGQGGTGGPGSEDNNPFNTGPDPVATNLDVKEQYGLGTPTTLVKPISPPDFTKVGPDSQFAKNTYLTNNFPEYSFKSKIPSINFLGNTLGKFGYNVNTNFFKKNSIGGKINPKTNEPFGYGIDGYKAYMEQRSLGNVGAYGNENMGQNTINASSGGDDGIMDVYNNPNDPDNGDSDGDGDVDQDDFIFRYFDKTGETLQAGAGGVQDLMTRIRQRINDIFS